MVNVLDKKTKQDEIVNKTICVFVYLASKKKSKQLQIIARPKTQLIITEKKPKLPNSLIKGVITNNGENAKPVKMYRSGLNNMISLPRSLINSYGKVLKNENFGSILLEFKTITTKMVKAIRAKAANEKIQIMLGAIILKV